MIKLKLADIKMIESLTKLPSVSGHECVFNSYLVKYLSKYKNLEIKLDTLKNMICFFPIHKNKPTLLIAAHKDKIGFLVENILPNGIIKLAKVGGINPLYMINNRLMLYDDQHWRFGILYINLNKENLHLSQMYGDFFFESKNEAERFVKIGQPIGFFPQFFNTDKHVITPYLDNTVGVFSCLKILEYLSQNPLDINVIFSFNSQEEVGSRGMKAMLSQFPKMQLPDPDLIIMIDVTSELDTVSLGKGPAITLYDHGIILCSKLREEIERVAKKLNIPYQLEVYTKGGTSDWQVTNVEGYPTLPLGVPTKKIHTPIETTTIIDIERTINLAIGLAKEHEAFLTPQSLPDPPLLTCPNCHFIECVSPLRTSHSVQEKKKQNKIEQEEDLPCLPKRSKRLNRLLKTVINEFWDIFNRAFDKKQVEKLKTVSIVWCDWYNLNTMSNTFLKGLYDGEKQIFAGYYHDLENLIEINFLLKDASDRALMSLIYHELLHIKLDGHGERLQKILNLFEGFDKYRYELDQIILEKIKDELRYRHDNRIYI